MLVLVIGVVNGEDFDPEKYETWVNNVDEAVKYIDDNIEGSGKLGEIGNQLSELEPNKMAEIVKKVNDNSQKNLAIILKAFGADLIEGFNAHKDDERNRFIKNVLEQQIKDKFSVENEIQVDLKDSDLEWDAELDAIKIKGGPTLIPNKKLNSAKVDGDKVKLGYTKEDGSTKTISFGKTVNGHINKNNFLIVNGKELGSPMFVSEGSKSGEEEIVIEKVGDKTKITLDNKDVVNNLKENGQHINPSRAMLYKKGENGKPDRFLTIPHGQTKVELTFDKDGNVVNNAGAGVLVMDKGYDAAVRAQFESKIENAIDNFKGVGPDSRAHYFELSSHANIVRGEIPKEYIGKSVIALKDDGSVEFYKVSAARFYPIENFNFKSVESNVMVMYLDLSGQGHFPQFRIGEDATIGQRLLQAVASGTPAQGTRLFKNGISILFGDTTGGNSKGGRGNQPRAGNFFEAQGPSPVGSGNPLRSRVRTHGPAGEGFAYGDIQEKSSTRPTSTRSLNLNRFSQTMSPPQGSRSTTVFSAAEIQRKLAEFLKAPWQQGTP